GLSDFLALYRKRSTREAYERAVRRYLEYVYDLPGGERKEYDYSGLSLRYLQEDRDPFTDLRGFIGFLGTMLRKLLASIGRPPFCGWRRPACS
ncbi:MAG: hypothetical protein PHR49_08130, partial [Methanoculleus sp.]|nr:hypothetical protein [Methanoculleus sp.]